MSVGLQVFFSASLLTSRSPSAVKPGLLPPSVVKTTTQQGSAVASERLSAFVCRSLLQFVPDSADQPLDQHDPSQQSVAYTNRI